MSSSWNMPDPVNLRRYIRQIPDFPRKGINFYDISTLLADAQGWALALSRLSAETAALKPDFLVGVESRGFLTAAPVAQRLGLGFGMVRKPGRLPGSVTEIAYDLEYGTDRLQIQTDLMPQGARVVIMDDLLATGGTLKTAADLAGRVGGQVAGAVVLIELEDLGGRRKVDFPVRSVLRY